MQTRNTLRLQNYDYKQNGCYFITLCTKNRYTYFGDIHNDQMQLSKVGEIIRSNWQRIPVHFTFALLDEFVIMPNHLHGIISIDHEDHNLLPEDIKEISRFQNLGKGSLSAIIGSFKSACSREINKVLKTQAFSWQSGFYEHIIRSEKALNKIRKYIVDNPIHWAMDHENPKNLREF